MVRDVKRETEDGYIRTNREMRQEPKGSKPHWCWGCDGQLVADGATCPICKKTDHKPRAKSGKPVVRE